MCFLQICHVFGFKEHCGSPEALEAFGAWKAAQSKRGPAIEHAMTADTVWPCMTRHDGWPEHGWYMLKWFRNCPACLVSFSFACHDCMRLYPGKWRLHLLCHVESSHVHWIWLRFFFTHWHTCLCFMLVLKHRKTLSSCPVSRPASRGHDEQWLEETKEERYKFRERLQALPLCKRSKARGPRTPIHSRR